MTQINNFVFVPTFMLFPDIEKERNQQGFCKKQYISREKKFGVRQPAFPVFAFFRFCLSNLAAHNTKATKGKKFKYFVHMLN